MRAGPDARAAGSSPAPSGAPAGRRAFLRAGAAAAAGLVLPRLAQAVGASVGITDVVVGTGAECGADSTAAVKMHYTLCLEGFEGEGGRVVDSSRTRGRPFRYTRTKGRGPVIAGWDMGVTGMKVRGGAPAGDSRALARRDRGARGLTLLLLFLLSATRLAAGGGWSFLPPSDTAQGTSGPSRPTPRCTLTSSCSASAIKPSAHEATAHRGVRRAWTSAQQKVSTN